MRGHPTGTGSAVAISTFGAAVMIAQQTGGKVTRDTLFLSNFEVTSLPAMISVAALFSILVVLGTNRLIATRGPARVVPWGFGVSGLLFVLEWALLDLRPGVASVMLYLHMAGLGLLLISWFWSLVNERFDPRTAKKRMGTIAAGAAMGGLLGGLLAERVGALATVGTMLPLLAGLNAVCAVVTFRIGAHPQAGEPAIDPRSSDPRYGLRTLRDTPYLRLLALLIVLGTVSATFIDYVFKSEATAAVAAGEPLMRFFALFYTAAGFLTFFVQTTMGTMLLSRIGLTRTVATLPAAVIGTGLGALFIPGIVSAAVARGSEMILRSSLFRSGYETLYTAVPRERKRAAKAIIDVGSDRVGDAVGGGLIQLVLMLGVVATRNVLLILAVALAMISVLAVRRIREGYVHSLEESLLKRAVELDMEEVIEQTTRRTLLHSLSRIPITPELRASLKPPAGDETPEVLPPMQDDPLLVRIQGLRSRNPSAVRRALQQGMLEPILVPHVLVLLAWDDLAEEAIRALMAPGPGIVGQLEDALLDPDQEFSIRRRVPRVLAGVIHPRAGDALWRGLQDRRFEVRFQCGRALVRLKDRGVKRAIGVNDVWGAIRQEVGVDPEVWSSRKLLERPHDERESEFVDRVLQNRANRNLEHVFSLMALILPREPLHVAFRGLHTDDAFLRGTALEYVQSVLPTDLWESLAPLLEGPGPRRTAGRQQKEIVDDLLKSRETIRIRLSELQQQDPE